MASDEMILMYTDGLVERRGDSLAGGSRSCWRRPNGRLSRAGMPMPMQRLVPPEGLDDDVAMLVLHDSLARGVAAAPCGRPEDAGRRAAGPAPLAARARRGRRDDVNEITLAVGEACANAIEHAYSPGPAWFEFDATESAAR